MMQGPSILHRAFGAPLFYSPLVTAPSMKISPSTASQMLHFSRPFASPETRAPSPSPTPAHAAAAGDTSVGKRPSFSIEAILSRSAEPDSRRARVDRGVASATAAAEAAVAAAWERSAQVGADSCSQEDGSSGYLRGAQAPLVYPVSALGYYPCSCHGTAVLRGRGEVCGAGHRAALHGSAPRATRGAKSKRLRTIFTQAQLERLEKEFVRQQYMVGTERFFLAAALHLTEAQVKVWFQNRRIKWRKQSFEQQQARLAKLGLAPLPAPTSALVPGRSLTQTPPSPPGAAPTPGPPAHGGGGSGGGSGSGESEEEEEERASPAAAAP